MSTISVANTMPIPATDARRVGRVGPLLVVIVLFVAVCSVAWRQPVSSMPLNRNDAAFYLVLAHNLVEHGVYSHQQVEPFAPHTEWPPGVPLWYAVPMSLVGSFPLGSSAWIIRAWALATAVLALWLVHRYLKLFCSNGVALAITAATAFSAAFLDEAQAALADIPALAASFFVLFEIEKHFASERTSRGRSIILHLSMAALPLVKPYLGVVFVAYLWKLFSCHGGWALLPVPASKKRTGKSAHPPRGIALVALCCVPFIAFMTYSVIAAREAGTISAVTWLTTDNSVAMREGAAATADQKTLTEWLAAAMNTARFHLIYHIASSPLPLLEATQLNDWPSLPRLATTLGMLILFGVGIVRSLRRAEGAAAAYTIAMLAAFSLLACDGSRYFIILTPLCAAMIWSGATCTVRSLIGTPIDVPDCGSSEARMNARGLRFNKMLLSAVVVCAVGSGLLWAQQRSQSSLDPDPFYRDVYSSLFQLRDRDDVVTIAVPYPLREVTIVETGKRVITHAEFLALSKAEQAATVLVLVDHDVRRAVSFETSEPLKEFLSRATCERLIDRDQLHVLRAKS